MYESLGDHDLALQKLREAEKIVLNFKDNRITKPLLGNILNNIGLTYNSRADYTQALKYLQEALKIALNSNEPSLIGNCLNNIGSVYSNRGDYDQALKHFQDALTSLSDIKEKVSIVPAFSNMGDMYRRRGDYNEALKSFNKALEIARSINQKTFISEALNNIGALYISRNSYNQALNSFQESLKIARSLGKESVIGIALNNIGDAYRRLGDYNQALPYVQEALKIAYKLDEKANIGNTSTNLGFLLQNNQPEIAIAFYKQAVNTYGKIRKDISSLPVEQQAIYTQTIAHTYRDLASLLLKKNRVMEAVQVLDLLKVQELRNFLYNDPDNRTSDTSINIFLQEQAILDSFNTKPTQNVAKFVQSPAIRTAIADLKNTAIPQSLQSSNYKFIQGSVQKLSKDAALFYPLVLGDRLELVVFIPGKAPIRKTVPVSQATLEATIKQFRSEIGDASPAGIPCHSITDAKTTAKKLHGWLIEKIEPELKAANIQTILYAPDGQLRYIPLAALYDGTEWLTQRYQINHLTALALTPLDSLSNRSPRTLAAAFTNESTKSYQFSIPIKTAQTQRTRAACGQSLGSLTFSGLKHSKAEVQNLANFLKPKPDLLLDQDFSKEAIVSRLPNYNILHLATHAVFVAGKPEESFIVMGNGEKLRLTDIKDWKLPQMQFVMLSACETGKGDQLGNGIEVLGFGYQLQQAKVRASMTSLWQVHDGSTRLLSDRFYQFAYTQPMPKTEALRQVQLQFIQGNMDIAIAKLRSGAEFGGNTSPRSPSSPSDKIDGSHPYYWAPFILIGNGL